MLSRNGLLLLQHIERSIWVLYVSLPVILMGRGGCERVFQFDKSDLQMIESI